MHDPLYRSSVAVQNIGYNQPAHVGYYFADGAPTPDIDMVEYDPLGYNAQRKGVHPIFGFRWRSG